MNQNQHYKFELMPLSYPYDALEPYIDQRTVRIHHDGHLKTYVNNLNNTLEPYPKYHDWTLEKLIIFNRILPKKIQTPVRHNAGGVYNHQLYFNIMSPHSDKSDAKRLMPEIEKQIGSYEEFADKFKKSALDVFGSGYAWLAMDRNGHLKIINTANQDTVLTINLCPVLLIDVWEHAYYLKYQNKRSDYIDNWFNIINWEQAEKNFIDCLRNFKLER